MEEGPAADTPPTPTASLTGAQLRSVFKFQCARVSAQKNTMKFRNLTVMVSGLRLRPARTPRVRRPRYTVSLEKIMFVFAA